MSSFECKQPPKPINEIEKAKSKIAEYINKCGYTYKVDDIIHEYIKYNQGCYVSYTAKDTIKHCIKHLKQIAAQALQEKLERDNPQPLSLEQLREMDGEPVWVIFGDGNEERWGIVRVNKYGVAVITNDNAYGCHWFDVNTEHPNIAYKHKPRYKNEIN